MKKTNFKVITTLVVLASMLFTQKVLAWHPVGVVVKQVQNQTTGTSLQDANDTTHAVDAKTGDVLRYVIEVRNDGNTDARGYNDMANVVLVDTLPAGLELISDPAQTEIKVELGTIKPKSKVVKEYLVKVTENVNRKLIENKACFSGNSTANDNSQAGCDVADIITNIPQTSSTSVTKVIPVVKSAVKSLPNTGPGSTFGMIAATASIGYISSLIFLSKRSQRNSR